MQRKYSHIQYKFQTDVKCAKAEKLTPHNRLKIR